LFEVDPIKWYTSYKSDRHISSSPYDILALTYLLSKKFEEAEKWYSGRLSKDHDNYQLLMGLANTEYNLGKYEEAEKLYRRVVELKPELERSYQQLAFVKALRMGDRAEGRRYAEIVKEKNAKNIYA
jgi:tetratricopeptide (TPR) repeat protein